MGTYRSKEDDVAKIATSIYITNFLEMISAKELFNSCKIYGHVVDSFIPNKRTKNGRRFGFVRFINVFNVDRLVSNLCMANVGFRDNNMKAKNNVVEKVIAKSIDLLGWENPMVVKGEEKKGIANEKTQPAMVLDDEWLISRDLLNFLMGRVKEFASLANLKMTMSNEGFTDIKIQYLGEFWVMLEFTSEEKMKTFQANGELLDVDDQEVTCYHSKILCIHTKMVRNISEEFKIIHQGKIYWVRANETPGWVPDFQDEIEDEEKDDNYMKFKGVNKQNSNISDDDNDVERISETVFPVDDQKGINKKEGEIDQKQENINKEEGETSQDPNTSEDPFKIYSLLDKFHKKDKTEVVSDGSLKYPLDLLIGVVYAPHEIKEKYMLWDYLHCEIARWKGQVVIMEDFNEVRVKSDRYGSVFNARGAQRFNSFVSDSGLVEINLGGCHYTWCHKSAKKISKLDRFLVSENLINNSSNITAISLDRYLSDHRPILLRERYVDYGPTPFKFFHYWLDIEGFNKIVEDAWKSLAVKDDNAIRYIMGKFKSVKSKIREWNSSYKNEAKKDKDKCIRDLVNIDDIIDSGMGERRKSLEEQRLLTKFKRLTVILQRNLRKRLKLRLPTWNSNDVVGVVRGLLQKEVREKTCYGKWAGEVSNRNNVLNCQGDWGTPPEGY
nr:RNA-directed DNA polymerase, eukaryota, reverse transcriptase zinc-binding domain protein [Tanacetum cinerariifolium]